MVLFAVACFLLFSSTASCLTVPLFHSVPQFPHRVSLLWHGAALSRTVSLPSMCLFHFVRLTNITFSPVSPVIGAALFFKICLSRSTMCCFHLAEVLACRGLFPSLSKWLTATVTGTEEFMASFLAASNTKGLPVMPNMQFSWHALSDKTWSFVFFQKLVLSSTPSLITLALNKQPPVGSKAGWKEGLQTGKVSWTSYWEVRGHENCCSWKRHYIVEWRGGTENRKTCCVLMGGSEEEVVSFYL